MIATSDVERSLGFPDVPTFKESGIDIVGTSWYGMFAPAKTPDDVVVRLNKAIVDAVKSPDVGPAADRLWSQSDRDVAGGTRPIQKAHADLWEPVIKASGFTAD